MDNTQLILDALNQMQNYNNQKNLEIDWLSVFKTAVEHRVELFVFEFYKDLWQMDFKQTDLFKLWLMRFLEVRQYNQFRDQQNAHFINELSLKGSDFVILKGPSLYSLFKDPSLRHMCDLDLFVPSQVGPSVGRAIVELGYNHNKDLKHDCHAVYTAPDRLSLELHWRLLDPHRFYEPAWFCDRAWQRKVSMPNYGDHAYKLHDEDHLVFLFCHAVKHIKSTGLGLKQLLDIKLLLETLDHDAIRGVIADLKRLRIYKASIYILELLNRYFEVSYPHSEEINEQILRDLFYEIIRAGAYGNKGEYKLEAVHFRKARIAGEVEADQSKWRVFFPAFSRMKKSYTWLERFPMLLPLAWGFRLKYQLKVHRRDAMDLLKTDVNLDHVNRRLAVVAFLED